LPALKPPARSTRAARAAFREAVATLEAIGEDATLSRGAIERYALAVGAWRELERAWLDAGRPSTTLGGSTGSVEVPHPLVAQLAQARAHAAELGDRLGLDPQARRRLARRTGAGRPAGAASAPDRAAPPRRRLKAVSE
jgi:P27 family predicted phage terminase small subunit